ncbi:hypothetical protein [Acaryochloris marina]|uniref:hypothetical protein n=1 Tax=Acaryochloris marina TaxID=155978 RepID=UPI0021C352F7|nr:hypothetical protein [Acaryochloris marina]
MSSVLLILISGCSSDSSKSKSKAQTEDPAAASSPAPLNSTPTKLKLTVASPESLRVKQGDLIVKGQILVDRTAARQNIMARRQKVQQEVALLTATEQIPTAPTNTNAAEVQVQQARERVRLADAAIQDYLAKSPYTDLARQTLPLPTEEKQLAQLQFAKTSAQAQLEQAIAQRKSLQASQQARQQGQAVASSKKIQLLNELKTIEAQLQSFQDILSPHDAIVQKVDWQKKGKNGTTVELALAVHSLSDPIPSLSNGTNNPLLSVPSPAPASGQPFPSLPAPLAPTPQPPGQVPTAAQQP